VDKIAIIGGGIVGASLAFYLSKEMKVDLYDGEKAQGTQAAVGIVSPWVNQRRNKKWYALANQAVHFYDRYLQDIGGESLKVHRGSLHIHDKQHDKLLKIAQERFEDAPAMRSIKEVDGNTFGDILGMTYEKGIWVEGSFQIDGESLLKVLQIRLLEQNVSIHTKMVDIEKVGSDLYVDGKRYDKVVLATGAWTGQLLRQLGYKNTFRTQKGELIIYDHIPKNNWPLVIPQGEYDYLFQDNQRLVVGASHEDKPLSEEWIDPKVIEKIKKASELQMPELINYKVSSVKVGFRSQTEDGVPVFGEVEDGLYLASGLGSSGLTTGPYIAYRLSEMILGRVIEEDILYAPFLKK